MTLKEFIKILDQNYYSYGRADGGLSVTHQGHVDLESLTTLPESVKFNNQGDVNLANCV